MTKKNNVDQSTYEQQENNLSKQSELFLNLLTQRGILGDAEIDNEKIRQAQRERKRLTYHNTEMLLKHYRDIRWVLECFPETIAEELDEPMRDLDAMLDRMEVEMAFGDRKLESRIESVKKSRLLLDRINEALSTLKRKPDDGERMYNLIYLTYITPEKLPRMEILDKLHVSSRHYYRLRQHAIHLLSIRLWSTPTAEIDSWLEILTLLEEL